MTISAIKEKSATKTIFAACIAMTIGLAMMGIARGMTTMEMATRIERVGQVVAGISFAVCMASIMRLNGNATGTTMEERLPTYALRSMTLIGILAGLALAIMGMMS